MDEEDGETGGGISAELYRRFARNRTGPDLARLGSRELRTVNR